MEEFARHYQIRFREPGLLRLALTHRSYLSVTGKGPRESNERLEFLGDSVLGLVTSEFLYRKHPDEHEGQLTKTKSLLVSKAILSRRALAMGLGRFVFMSHSEVESGGRQRLSILADAFESVVGAIYLDQGFEPARKFIHDWLLSEAREIAADKRHTNYKSHLQEYVQSTFRTHPVYRIRSEIGPDHSKQFMVDVVVGRRVMGSGKGRNKKEAEQAAARDALEKAHHKIAEPVADEPDAPPPPPRGAGPERESEPDESRSRRRGRRGGRGRRSDAVPGEPDHPPSMGEGESEAEGTAPEPRRPQPRPAESPGPSVRQGGSRRREPEPRPRPEARPRAPRADDSALAWERTRREYEEEDMEEIGRPEGPVEERHVDPFGLEGGAEKQAGGAEATHAGPAFGRTVVGPMHAGRSMSFEAAVEPESAPLRDDDRAEEAQRSEARGGEAPPREELKRPDSGDRPAGPAGYGRRPGRSRRGPR